MTNIITNGTFESGSANWTYNNLVNITFNDLKGSIVARLLPGGVLSQSLSLSSNTTYTLKFKSYAFYPGGPLQVNVGGTTKTIDIKSLIYENRYYDYTETFVTPASISTDNKKITFTNPTSETTYILIDDVSLEGPTETSNYIMYLGLATAGYIAYKLFTKKSKSKR